MTTKDEALKLALEALESLFSGKADQDRAKRCSDAITAIREALAEQPAQQEPVAWMFQHEETGRTMCVDAQQVEWGFEKGNPRLKKIAPLYTSPSASKPWVGLTDEQIMEMYNEPRSDAEMIAFARAIEAAHGIGEQK